MTTTFDEPLYPERTNKELRELASRWSTETGDIFGDPRVEIPALVHEILTLRDILNSPLSEEYGG